LGNQQYEDEDLDDVDLEADEDEGEGLEEDNEDEDEDDEDESNEIFNRLATRINAKGQGNLIAQPNNLSTSHDDVENRNLPSIKEYKNVLDQWPPAQIAVVALTQKKTGTAVPSDILTEARAICKLYKQQKAMLSIMGNISKFTLDKAL
jgi:hypothetical protein